MMNWRIGLGGAMALLLAACSTPDRRDREAALPPPEAELRVAPAEGATIEETEVILETEESLAVEYIYAEPPPEPIVYSTPEVSGWTNSEVPLTRQQSDIEACYNYAAALVARDARIDSDRRQSLEDTDDPVGLARLESRIDYYDEPRRRANLFERCMNAKGYIRE